MRASCVVCVLLACVPGAGCQLLVTFESVPEGAGGGAGSMTTSTGGGTTTEDATTTSDMDTTTASTTETASTTTDTTTTTTTTTNTTTGFVLDCGGQQCQSDTQACCWDEHGTGGPKEYGKCVATPVTMDQCNNDLSIEGAQSIIECQSPSHCTGGQICCGNRVVIQQQAYYYDVVACVDSCDYPDLVLCDGIGEDAPCPVVLSAGQMVQTQCEPSTLLPPGYFVCGVP